MKNSSLHKIFKTLDLIFLSIIASQLFLFFTFLFISNKTELIADFFSGNELKVIAIILNSTMILSTKLLQKKFTKNHLSKKSLEEKIHSFRLLSIIRLALLESGNIINLVFYLMTGDSIFLLIFGALFILQFAYRPLPKLMIREFNLPLEKINEIL